MIKRTFIVVVMIMCSAFAKAQLESSQWFFGENAGIDFRSGTVTQTDVSNMQTGEGCATIADADGNLLFYTDGSTVFNRAHQIMPNGTGLKGNSSSTSSAIIVPSPSDTHLFYIFTVDTDDLRYRLAEGLHYSIVDISLDNGNGDVLQDSKNTQLLARTSEKLTAVENGTDDGFWILTQFEDTFYSYELTASGLNTNPVLSQLDPFIELVDFFITNVDVAAMRGYLKINSAGDKIAAAHFSNNTSEDFQNITNVVEARSLAYAQGGELYLYDFNNNTGIVNNPVPLMTREDGGSFYGVEFSPSGQYLYVEIDYFEPSTVRLFDFLGGEIAQFDLNAADIARSKRTLHQDQIDQFRGALQIGIDGKIYHARANQNALSVLSNPNDQQVPVNYTFNQQPLSDNTLSIFGLPLFVQSFFQEFEINIEDSCEGELVNYSVSTNTATFDVVWDFGDPDLGTANTSNTSNGSIIYNTDGIYNVTARINTAFQEIILTKEITINNQVQLNEVPLILTTCDLGFDTTVFDISTIASDINAASDQMVSIHTTLEDALSMENPVDPALPFTANESQQSLFLRISNANCFEIIEIQLIVERCAINVFNAVSPNGDGLNDFLEIEGLRGVFENFQINIYNRYGRLVWNGGPDTQSWDGTSNVINTNELLPVGTYFYTIILNDPTLDNLAGYIYLVY